MMELVSEEQVINAVRSKGPLIPIEIRQIIKAGDSITIGATLSTLSDRGVVQITHIKRGGSPFYYVAGQEEKLGELSKFLGEKDRRTFESLKQGKIMRDKTEEPLTRISLRNIPDFARSISIDFEGNKEVFWRYYMVSEEEALGLIKKGNREKSEEPKQEVKAQETKTLERETPKQKEEPKQEREAKPKEEQKTAAKVQKEPIVLKEEAAKKEEFLEVRSEVQQQLEAGQNNQAITNFNDGFITKIGSFLSSGKVAIREVKQIKKGAEYDLVLDIPTPVGNMEYFCKAKAKKKCNEGDLSSASVQGQNMRLPVLFITTGEVVKKAKEKLRSDFKGMVLKELKN